LVVALTERFAPVLEVVVAAAVAAVEGTVEEVETEAAMEVEAEATQPLRRTRVSLFHHLIVLFLPDRITAAKPAITTTRQTTTATQPTSTFIPPPTRTTTPSIQPTPTPEPGFNNVVITQSSTEITWSSGWTVQVSSCNGTEQSRLTTTSNQWFTFISSPDSGK
jgi:hypothetical protein